MKDIAVSNSMNAIIILYDMQTTFFSSAIDGISDADAQNRLHTKANHIAWLTGSLVQQRFELAKALGTNHQQSAHELFDNNKGIIDDLTYPSLASFKNDKDKISPLFRNMLLQVTDDKLNSSFTMGDMQMTYADWIYFMIYREANCIGQIALWRRLLGYDAMKYM